MPLHHPQLEGLAHTSSTAASTALAFTLEWDLSHAAVVLTDGEAPAAVRSTILRWAIGPSNDGSSAVMARASLHRGDRVREIAPASPVTITRDTSNGLLHIDLADQLILTMRDSQLLLAWTSWLDRLNVLGGRADKPRVRAV